MNLELLSTAVLAVATCSPMVRNRSRLPGPASEAAVMQASVGDRLVIASRHLDERLRSGEIVEVHGADGAPPYVVRWAGEERGALVFPGPDAHVEPGATRPGQPK